MGAEMPKVTFNAKEMFDKAMDLSKKAPYWKNPQENPINYFVPDSEQTMKESKLG